MDANENLKSVLQKRIAELSGYVDQSAANHHSLLGRFLEAKEALANFEKSIVNEVKALENAAAAPAASAPAAPAVAPATEDPTAASAASSTDTPPTVQ